MDLTFFLIPVSLLFLHQIVTQVSGYEPEFTEGLNNLTVAVGRDATFSCVVEHLGGYRVGWVKADTKAIQAIHEHVITHNPRVSVSHSGHTTWNLHIKSVEEPDRGTYMCQVNTDPMKSVMGYLDVVVPPDIVDEESSGDVSVSEGGSVSLVCRARGYPTPDIVWKREDRADIVFRDAAGLRKTPVHEGATLRLNKVSRSDMGHYMCMAQNGVPPAVSKRISLTVNFPPVIVVPNQLVGAPLGTDVTLACHVEASPKAIMYWMRDGSALLGDNMVVSSDKYETKVSVRSIFEKRMLLTVRDLDKQDVGTYRCVAKNSLGEVERNIRLYEIPGAAVRRPAFPERSDDEDEEPGSAEAESEPPPKRQEHSLPAPTPAAAASATATAPAALLLFAALLL